MDEMIDNEYIFCRLKMSRYKGHGNKKVYSEKKVLLKEGRT